MDQGNLPNLDEEENTDIYKMYEEMLQLVKDGLDTPVKEEIERVPTEEKKLDSDLDDEGFNDERDEEF